MNQYGTTDKIEKPVSTLALVPRTGTITRIGRQAYTIMILIAREQGTEEESTGLFTAPLNSVIYGFDGAKGTVEELKKHLKSMVTHVVEWQSPSSGETGEWGACTLLSEVRLFKRKGENWVSWAYPPSMRQDLLSPLRYAQIRRSTIAQFRSHAGLALYEICARYKNNPSHLTSKQHWHWWLPVLTGKPLPKDIKTEFRFFNRDTIKPAIQEVNEVSELIITSHELKIGRSVEFIQFEVHQKPNSDKIKNFRAIDVSKLTRAMELGIDVNVAEELYIRYGELSFSNAVNRLDERIKLKKAPPLISYIAYLKSLLAGRVIDNSNKIIESKDGDVAQPIVNSKVNPAEIKFRKLHELESDRVSLIRSEIESLNKISINNLLDELKQQLIVKGISASIIKRIDDGRWQSALIMGELIRFYWKKTRGTEWSSTIES